MTKLMVLGFVTFVFCSLASVLAPSPHVVAWAAAHQTQAQTRTESRVMVFAEIEIIGDPAVVLASR